MSTLTAPSKAAKTAQLLTENWLRNVFPSDHYTVRARAAGEDGDCPPAVVVTHLCPQGGDEAAPVLVVEVSDVPASGETAEETGRYAAAGVRDLWVIEVGARQIRVFRDPQSNPDAKHGAAYKQARVYSTYSLIAPLAAEIHLAQVVNLLPW
jgi:Uma2 family endonuclease